MTRREITSTIITGTGDIITITITVQTNTTIITDTMSPRVIATKADLAIFVPVGCQY
jgi:hypothetical protein